MDVRLGGRAVTLLAVLALVGCGSEDGGGEAGRDRLEKVLATIAPLEGQARERKLEDLAKAEGAKLTVYTSLATDKASAVAKAFEDAHHIDVSVYRAQSPAVAERVSKETKAGFGGGADVVESSGSEMATLAKDGIFVPYRSPEERNLVAGVAHGSWTTDRYNRLIVSWNTRRVRPGRQPRTWEELADPRWRGKLALEDSASDWYMALYEHWVGREGKSKAEADRLFESIARNARVFSGNSLMAQLLAAGEYDVAVASLLSLAKDSVEAGAPVSYRPVVEPVFYRPQGVALLKPVRHPAASALFVDWLLSDGQEVLEKYNHEPVRKDLVAKREVEEFPIDVERFVAERDEWDDRWERLIRLGQKRAG